MSRPATRREMLSEMVPLNHSLATVKCRLFGIKGLLVKTIGELVDGDERPWRRTVEQIPGVPASEEELYPAHVASIT